MIEGKAQPGIRHIVKCGYCDATIVGDSEAVEQRLCFIDPVARRQDVQPRELQRRRIVRAGGDVVA